MKPNLYICHTAYQVLVDLLRAGRAGGGPPHHGTLRRRGRCQGAVRPAGQDRRGADRAGGRDPLAGTVTGPLASLRARRAFESLCGWKLDRARYENVYIHNDWSVLGRYLQDCHAGYILCEDTFGSTLGPDQHLVTDQRATPDFAKKQQSGKGYLYWGDSPWCKCCGERGRQPLHAVRPRQTGQRQQGRAAPVADRRRKGHGAQRLSDPTAAL